MTTIRRLFLIVVALTAIVSLASCNGGGGLPPVNPGEEMTILLPSGAGTIFPADSFAAQTNVTVTESLTKQQRDVASFPADAGALLGALSIGVPDGTLLAKNITVLIALNGSVATNLEYTVFMYNSTTGMWESTVAGASGTHNTSVLARVQGGDVVSFTAPTADTTGLDVAYGIFANYKEEIPGGGGDDPNHIPTVDLSVSDDTLDVGAEATLTATGADEDDDTLTFTWLSPGGTLGTPNTAGNTSTATWSAAAGGSYVVSVSCSDGNGGVATDLASITVYAAPVPEPIIITTAAQPGYVGSATCITCHGDSIDAGLFNSHRHSHKLNPATSDYIGNWWQGSQTFTKDDFSIDMEFSRDGYLYTATIGPKTYEIVRAMGWGVDKWKQRYVVKAGNSWYMTPAQWNVVQTKWVGYNANNWNVAGDPLVDKSFDRNCVGCHATGPNVQYSTETGEWVSGFSEENVRCEACHGPGQAHVTNPSQSSITVPGDLSSERQVELCGSCHGRGTSVVKLGDKTDLPPLIGPIGESEMTIHHAACCA